MQRVVDAVQACDARNDYRTTKAGYKKLFQKPMLHFQSDDCLLKIAH